jgi:hypothetical protein
MSLAVEQTHSPSESPLRTGLIDARFWAAVGVVLSAAAARLIPHPWNMTPVFAMALFGGAYFSRRWAAFAVPLAAMLISDVVLAWRDYGMPAVRSQPLVYLNLAGWVLMGIVIQRHRRFWPILGCTLLGTAVFFVTTNFGVWYGSTLYPQTPVGLLTCYEAAVPFLRNEIIGNLAYTALFFGGFALAERRFGVLREQTVPATVPVR